MSDIEISSVKAKVHYRNFDTLRLIGAVAVLFSHGFLIAEVNDPDKYQGFILGLGGYGVEVFFILSGFLVTRSWLSSSSGASYFWKRFLRIYPAYLASILIVTLVVVPLLAVQAPVDYFRSGETWWALNNALHFDYEEYWISGVAFYQSDSDLNGVMNGVLWTIQAEVLLYIFVAILGLLRILRAKVVIAISLIFFVFNQLNYLLYFSVFDYFYMNWWTLTRLIHGVGYEGLAGVA
ncbi:acyltransferase family protein [Croceicoccus sp. Ery15]|uniref:acyltransferase family protein n=1 Tax=Croceicoccus sp. Ery15 TaxID=1703338 RepID=UPI001E54D4A0|nr:acyltransferase [Croceicoccus sp. Ery15]